MKQLIKALPIMFAVCILTNHVFAQKPSPDLLNPTNHALVLIDYQSEMGFAVKNISIEELRDNTAIVAGASKIFNVPTVVTTVAEKSFSGPVFPEVREFYAGN